jgi:hypothetical protein
LGHRRKWTSRFRIIVVPRHYIFLTMDLTLLECAMVWIWFECVLQGLVCWNLISIVR